MSRMNRKKASKVTYKTHHKHQLLPKEEMKQLQGGQQSLFQTRRSNPAHIKNK
jgi:hypothetical protein